jgi:drug/metabolite transporter (DMT)-like permease
VTARLVGGAIVLAIIATMVHRTWVREAFTYRRTVVFYGVIPIAGAQLCYYNAVAHMSVGVALLLEYLSPVLVVGWLWATTRHRPCNLTLAGVAMAIGGIMLVLNVFAGAHVDVVGVAWALAAAVCAACYFIVSDRAAADGTGLHSITLAAGGLVVGAIAISMLGVSGMLPLAFTAHDTVVAGATTSWLVPVIAMAVVPTALAYTLGIMGIARLRPRFASLVGLTEVMAAVLWAWLLVGEAITASQAIGGIVVLLGLALARHGDRTEILAEATWPETPALPSRAEQTTAADRSV